MFYLFVFTLAAVFIGGMVIVRFSGPPPRKVQPVRPLPPRQRTPLSLAELRSGPPNRRVRGPLTAKDLEVLERL